MALLSTLSDMKYCDGQYIVKNEKNEKAHHLYKQWLNCP